MNVIHHADELPGAPRRASIAIGVFDGIHLGHQQVIRQTVADASHFEAASVAVTFDRHPNSIVAPSAVPAAICSLDQKIEVIASLGVETALVIHFDEAFSRMPAEDFIRGLMRGFGVLSSVCVGREFAFGYRRQGNVALLQRLAGEHGFQLHALAAVSLDGEVVSSTRIRSCIQSGDLDAAGQMLGRDYRLSGSIVAGDRLGRKLGIPTANLEVSGLATPPLGVYAVHVVHQGQTHRGVANIGTRPTVTGTSGETTVEVHLLDFDGDLYGSTVTVEFVRRLREEKRFDSMDALRSQIGKDIEQARHCFGD